MPGEFEKGVEGNIRYLVIWPSMWISAVLFVNTITDWTTDIFETTDIAFCSDYRAVVNVKTHFYLFRILEM